MSTSENIEEMTDEQTLRRLIDESDDFDFRRRIRARLRQLKKEASPAVEAENRGNQSTQFIKPQRSHVTSDLRPKSVASTGPLEKKGQTGQKESLDRSTNLLRTDKSNTTSIRPVSTTGVAQLESVALRKSPRRSGVEPKRVDSSGARLETVVLRKVETKKTKDETPKPRSNAAKVTTKTAFKHFKELDVNSNAGRRYLEVGAENGALAARRCQSPNSIRDQMLNWCRARVSCYDDISIDDFSTSWSDGMAFCALVHSFYPEAFDYDALDRKDKAKNFQLAFDTAEKLAGVVPLLEVEDMVRTSSPDWKCVFTYINCFANRMSEIRKEKKQAEQLQREKELGRERPEEEVKKQELKQENGSD